MGCRGHMYCEERRRKLYLCRHLRQAIVSGCNLLICHKALMVLSHVFQIRLIKRYMPHRTYRWTKLVQNVGFLIEDVAGMIQISLRKRYMHIVLSDELNSCKYGVSYWRWLEWCSMTIDLSYGLPIYVIYPEWEERDTDLVVLSNICSCW